LLHYLDVLKVWCYVVASHVELKLFSLHYLDALQVLEDGDLQTLGMLDYDNRLTHSFTAHPKVDPFTGKDILLKRNSVSHCNGRVPFNLQNPSMQARCLHLAIQLHHHISLTE
jgi:carotenoid cleavage dioxygenase-like enzyme